MIERTSAGPAIGRGQRIEGLDALRGGAVFLVMLRHAFPSVFPGAGIVGVTAFFALSGYLISGLLVRDLDRFHTVRWGRFYAHRAFRLYPALLFLLVVYAVVELVFAPLGDRRLIGQSLAMGVTYTSDLPLPWQMASGLTHLWTLASEEQFYLVWPLVLLLCSRAGIRLPWVAGVAAVLLTAVCLATLAMSSHPADIYERPTTWASAMALGALGYGVRDRLSALPPRVRGSAAVIALVVLAALCVLPGAKDRPLTYVLGPTVIAVATLALILVTQRWLTVPTIALRPAVWLGTISYGVYLWNLPVVSWIRLSHPHGASVLLLLSIPATIVAAALSWYTVEAFGRVGRRALDRRSAASRAERASLPSA